MVNNGFIPPEAKDDTEGFIPPEVKKKDPTSQRDLHSLSKALGESMSERGETMAEVDLQPVEPTEQQPLEDKKTYQEVLGIGDTKLEFTRDDQVQEIDIKAIEQSELIAKEDKILEDKAIENKATKTVENAFFRAMNKEGRRGIPIEEGDVPKTRKELLVLEDAKKNYNVELEMKMETHLPEEMKTKSFLVAKEREIWDTIKSPESTNVEKLKAREQLKEINTQLGELSFDQKLFDPSTGETVDKEEATPEAGNYSSKVSVLQKGYETDIEKAYNVADKVLHKYDLYNDKLDEKVSYERVSDGREIIYEHLTYRDLLNPGQRMKSTSQGAGNLPQSEIDKFNILKEKWVDAKADAEAVSRAIMLNEDPSQIERGFGGEAGFWGSASKGFREGIGFEETVTSTEGDFPTKWNKIVSESGEKGLLTKAQVDNAQQTFTEKVGYGVGASLPIMAEIAATTVLTEGTATIPVVASRIAQIKNLFGATKAGKLFANVLEQGVKGYVTFAPTEETGATGVGEGVAQGFLDTLLPEKLISGKYGKLLNLAIRTVGGGAGETVGELSGQYFDALNENGYDAREAFSDAFGRTPEERWENLAIIGTTSLLFSGAFNAPRLAMTQKALQEEIDNGSVPEEDQEAVKEIISEIDNKLQSEEADTTETPIKEEISVVKEEPKIKEDAIQEKEEVQEKEIKPEPKPEPRAEEQPTDKDARRITEPDKKQRETKGDVLKEVEKPTSKESLQVEKVEVKETPKGVDLEYTQRRSGKMEKITFKNVNTKEVLHEDKNGNKLHKSDSGFVTTNKKGNVVSPKTTSRLVKEYQQDFDYTKGKKAELNEGMTGQEADRKISETSENPEELAMLIDRRVADEESIKSQSDTTKEGYIADILTQGSVNPDSFMANTGLKRKDIHGGIKLHYFRKDGKGLDILAKEASENSTQQTDEGQAYNITEQDIVDFINSNPNSRDSYYKEFGSDEILEEAKSKFRDITGFEPTESVINKSTEQSFGKKEVIIKDKTKQDDVSNKGAQKADGEINESNRRVKEVSNELRRRADKTQKKPKDSSGDGRKILPEEENKIAFDYAKETNTWVDDIYSLGEPFVNGNESTNALNKKEDKVYKSNNLSNSEYSIDKLFKSVKLHNLIFPGTSYEFVGFTGLENKKSGKPYVEVIHKQDFIENSSPATPKEISDYMNSLGFKKIDDSTFKKGDLEVSDLRPRNVLKDKNGNIFVVDAEFKGDIDSIEKSIQKIGLKKDTKEDILKEITNLQEGHSTNEIYKRAVESGLNEDQEVKQAISDKAKSFKEYQEKINRELGIGEDFDLPFQKTSNKPIAGKKYLGGMINTLKKSIPGLEVEFDQNIDGLGTIRNGKVVINPKKASTDTPIHEFAHVWTKILKAKNNTLYKSGIRLVKDNNDLMEYISSSRPDLTTEEDIAEEALVTAIGEDGAEFFDTKVEQSKLKNILEQISKAIRKFFGIKKNLSWRDISELTLKDFTKLANEELLNKTPLTTVTQEDVKNIMSEELILNDLHIDSEILSNKGRNTIGKVKDFIGGILMTKGKLPDYVAKMDNNTLAAIEAIKSEAGSDIKIFNTFLKEHIKENNLSTSEVNKLMNGINDVLTGERTVNSLGIEDTDLSLGVAAMRNTIDKMSEELVNSGYIEGDIITTINENMGMYMRRSYEIHKAKPKTTSDWINKLIKHTPEVVAKAREFIVDQYGLSRVTGINFKNNKDGTYKVTLENEFGHESSSQTMSRADLIAVLQEGKPTMITDGTVKELDIDTGSIELNESVNPKKYGIDFKLKEEDVTEVINDIIDKHLVGEEIFGIAGLNKKDVSILKKRKDIPKEIRALLGEITDPIANYMETVSKMSTLMEYSKFLHRLKKEGEGTLIWSKEDKPKGLDITRISAENNPRWKPLDGMYTTKQFLDALQHFEKESLVAIKGAEKINAFAMLLNTITKSSLTKWNIPSNFRNHYGAVMMAARMGYVNPVNFAKAYSDYWKGVKTSESKGFDREEFSKMKSLGLIDDGVGYQMYKESLQRAMKTSSLIKKSLEKLSKSTVGKIAQSPRDFMDKMYLAPDAAAKMFLFREMKKDYTKAYPELTEEQIDEKVADIVKDTMPTYSKMSKGAKALSRNPIFGAFSSFTTEVVRNYVNQINLIKQEFSDYQETKNPHLKKLIDKKITGLIGMTILVPALATTLKAALGISNDDDEAIRSVAPEWEKNSWKLYLGKGKDGSIVGVDLSYVDPLAVMTKPMYALINGVANEDMDAVDTAHETIKEMMAQFTGEEPLFNAMWEAAANTDRYGRPIAKPLQGEEWKRATHVIDVMKPKFIDNFIDAKKAYIDKHNEGQEGFGKKYDPTTYTFSVLGFGVRDRDILKSTGFKISGEIRAEDGVNDAQNIYKYSDDKSQEDLDKANTALAKIFNEHMLNIEAARVTGASEVQIRQMLNARNKSGNRYIPEYWSKQLLRKQFIPIRAERKRTRK